MSNLRFKIMGCGHSSGTPSICNYWGKCDPNEPRNKRTRASFLVQSDSSDIVIDTGPDFKRQVNLANLEKIDAILYTHPHSDHVIGIDEARILTLKDKIVTNIYGNSFTINDIRKRFEYLFVTKMEGIYPKVIDGNIIEDSMLNKPVTVSGIEFIPFNQDHFSCTTLGYRFGDVAYSTDFVDLEQQALETLSGVKVWIADGCGYHMANNKVHANLKKLYELNEIIQADKVIVTHLSTEMDYQTLCNELPDGFEAAYDGMEVKVD